MVVVVVVLRLLISRRKSPSKEQKEGLLWKEKNCGIQGNLVTGNSQNMPAFIHLLNISGMYKNMTLSLNLSKRGGSYDSKLG